MEEQPQESTVVAQLRFDQPLQVTNSVQVTMSDMAEFGYSLYLERWAEYLEEIKQSEYPQDITRNWMDAQHEILQVIKSCLPEVDRFMEYIKTQSKGTVEAIFSGHDWSFSIHIQKDSESSLTIPERVFLTSEKKKEMVVRVRENFTYQKWKDAYTLWSSDRYRQCHESRSPIHEEAEVKRITQRILLSGSMRGATMREIRDELIKEFDKIIKDSLTRNEGYFPWFL